MCMCVCVHLHVCVTEVKGTKPQDTECPKQDGRAMFGLPHTPFLCAHSSSFFGWDQDWTPDSRQGSNWCVQINYVGVVAFKLRWRVVVLRLKKEKSAGFKLTWSRLCTHTRTNAHTGKNHTLWNILSAQQCASVRPHLLRLAVFAPVTRWSCDAAATKGHQSRRPNNGTSALAGVSLILVCSHMCFV